MPTAQAISGLLQKGCIRAHGLNRHTTGIFYQATPFGRIVATVVEDVLVALEPMTLYCLPHASLLRITHEVPAFGEAMLKAVSARLRWAHNLTHIMQTLPAFGRVCAILVGLAERYGGSVEDGVLVDVSLTHEHLAALVGVTRQFATVTLHELVREELITLRRRKIVVHDPALLRRRAGVF